MIARTGSRSAEGAHMIPELIANLPLFLPGSVSFHKYHLKHHSFPGVYELDADIPGGGRRAGLGSVLGKALWLLFYRSFNCAAGCE